MKRAATPSILVRAALLLLCTAVAWSAAAAGKDVHGSKDSPLVSRYAGSWIIGYKHQRYGALTLPLSKSKHAALDKVRRAEGELTRILYVNPPGRSALEVFRNYQQALAQGGFKILFQCEGKAGCGALFHQAIYPRDQHLTNTRPADFAFSGVADQFFLSAQLTDAAHGDAFVSLYVATDENEAGVYSGPKRVMSLLQIVHTQPMESGQVKVDAAALAKGLEHNGHVAIYGVYFDTDSARIKPASGAQLEEMAKYLKAHPHAGVYIVGHTDNQGKLAYNLDLSRRRAKAVVDTLVAQYHVPAARLTAEGVGPLAPVAANASDAGRAKNRRVELVLR